MRSFNTPGLPDGIAADLSRLRIDYSIRARISEGINFPRVAPELDGKILTLDAGNVTLAGHQLGSAHFSSTGLHWSEATNEFFSAGVLRFTPERLSCIGFVFFGRTIAVAKRYDVSGVAEPITFRMNSLGEPNPLFISLRCHEASVESPKPPRIDILVNSIDVSSTATLRNVAGGVLRLTLTGGREPGSSPAEPLPLPLSAATLNLNLMSGTAAGSIGTSSQSRSGLASEWTGSIVSRGLQASFESSSKATAITAPKKVPLSVLDLATLDLSGAAAAQNTLVSQNLVWAIEQPWVDAFYSVDRPDLSGQPTRMANIDKDCEWYNQTFAPAILGWGLNDATGPGSPTTKLSTDQAAKLKYYLTSGISQDAIYVRQTEALSVQSAIVACPRLGEYVKASGKQWAEDLYQFLTGSGQMSNLITAIQTNPSGGVAQLTAYATILTALDPSGHHARDFYNKAMGAASVALSLSYNTMTDDDSVAFLGAGIQGFITEYLSQTQPIDPGKLAQWQVASALSAFAELEGGVDEAATQICVVINSVRTGQLLPDASAAASAFEAKYGSKIANGGNMILTAALIVGTYFSIRALLNWDTTPAPTQAAVATNLVRLVGKSIEDLPAIANSLEWAVEGFANLILRAFVKKAGEFVAGALAASENWIFIASQWMVNAFNAASKTITTAGTQLAAAFPAIATAMTWLPGICAAALFGISVWQFVKDVREGKSLTSTVVDGLQMGISFVVAVSVILTLAELSLVICPILAVVFALLGALLALISFFLPSDEQSPADEYMENLVVPLVNALPEPPSQGFIVAEKILAYV